MVSEQSSIGLQLQHIIGRQIEQDLKTPKPPGLGEAFAQGILPGAFPVVFDAPGPEVVSNPGFAAGSGAGAILRSVLPFLAGPTAGFANLASQGFELNTAQQLSDIESGRQQNFSVPSALTQTALFPLLAKVPFAAGARPLTRFATGAGLGAAAGALPVLTEQALEEGQFDLTAPDLQASTGISTAIGAVLGPLGALGPPAARRFLRRVTTDDNSNRRISIDTHGGDARGTDLPIRPDSVPDDQKVGQRPEVPQSGVEDIDLFGTTKLNLTQEQLTKPRRVVNEKQFERFVHGDPKPRFNKLPLQFDSDVDRALYIVANRNLLSGADDKFLGFAREVFPTLDDAKILQIAEKVRTEVVTSGKAGKGSIPKTFNRFLDDVFAPDISTVGQPRSTTGPRLLTKPLSQKQLNQLIRETGNPKLIQKNVKRGLYVVGDEAELESLVLDRGRTGFDVEVGGRPGKVVGQIGDQVGVRFQDTNALDVFPAERVLEKQQAQAIPPPAATDGPTPKSNVRKSKRQAFSLEEVEQKGPGFFNDLDESKTVEFGGETFTPRPKETARILEQHLGKDTILTAPVRTEKIGGGSGEFDRSQLQKTFRVADFRVNDNGLAVKVINDKQQFAEYFIDDFHPQGSGSGFLDVPKVVEGADRSLFEPVNRGPRQKVKSSVNEAQGAAAKRLSSIDPNNKKFQKLDKIFSGKVTKKKLEDAQNVIRSMDEAEAKQFEDAVKEMTGTC